MATITISDQDLAPLKGKVVIVTGGSSGIGLATVKLLSSLGAKVVLGDLNPPPDLDDTNVLYYHLDVTSWKDLVGMFKKALEIHRVIDHVFCNAGIGSSADYLSDDVDEKGDPLEPSTKTIDINLLSVTNTAKLAVFYMKKQKDGGSIVITASIASFQRFGVADYTVAKHGVLGFMRGLHPHLHPKLPIRMNIISPSWTQSAIMPQVVLDILGSTVQPADTVARAAALLMTDSTRHGQAIYCCQGHYKEVEEAMLKSMFEITDIPGARNDFQKMLQEAVHRAAEAKKKPE